MESNDNLTYDPLERKWAKEIYPVIKSLYLQGVFSPLPENVVIERPDSKPIYPCARSYGPEGLDIRQLKWAAENGRFWFNLPIKCLKVTVDRGPVKGHLQLEINRILFVTSLNRLNYRNFETTIRRVREFSERLALGVHFSQTSGSAEVAVTVSLEKPLSEHNVSEFLDKIGKMLGQTEY